jgi:predicted RNA-binding Zn ribbon-like protein
MRLVKGKRMQQPMSRPPPFFIGDHAAMDFLNTTAVPHGQAIEWLANGKDLLDWLQRAKLIDDGGLRHFRGAARPELDNTARDARALREWLRGFVEKHASKPLRPNALAELETLNRLLASADVYHRIVHTAADAHRKDGSGLDLELQHRWTKPASLLQPLALAMGDLICHVDFRLIRRCENPDCTMMFYDRTKSHARRWCSMAACGNRAKVAAFRARQKDNQTS